MDGSFLSFLVMIIISTTTCGLGSEVCELRTYMGIDRYVWDSFLIYLKS